MTQKEAGMVIKPLNERYHESGNRVLNFELKRTFHLRLPGTKRRLFT